MMAYITRLKKIKEAVKANRNAVIITERCLETDRFVFEKMLYEEGYINEIEHKIYATWFDEFKEYAQINTIIYVGTDPTVCHKRIMKRNRSGENCISLEYLTKCHKYHNEWIHKLKISTLVIDGNLENKSSNDIIAQHITNISSFLNIDQTKRANTDVDSVKWLTAC